MNVEPGITFATVAEAAAIVESAPATGEARFRLDTDRVKDRAGLFEAFRRALPLDPPVVSDRSWDALSDSMWEAVHQSPGDAATIVWLNSAAVRLAVPHEYEMAIAVLGQVIESLAVPEFTSDHPTRLHVFVA